MSLAIDNTDFATNERVTLTATPNQPLSAAGGAYIVYVEDLTTDSVLVACPSLTAAGTCVTSTRFTTGGAHTYRAYVATGYAGTPVSFTDVQATSNDVSAQRAAWTVGLAADKTVFAAGDRVALTATVNQDIQSSSYATFLVDVTTNTLLGYCVHGYTSSATWDATTKTCTSTTSFSTGGAHTYRAYVATSYSSGSTPADVQATSNDVSAQRAAWTVGLAADKTVFAAGDRVALTATVNQDIQSSSYATFLVDVTTNTLLGYCVHGYTSSATWDATTKTCTSTANVSTGRSHSYLAYVATSYNGTASDVQAISNGFSAPNDGGPTLPGEVGGGYNPSQACSQRCHHDPVNSETGELAESATDMAIPGAGPGLSWSRSYGSSLTANDTGLGHGWSLAFGLHLVPNGGSTLTSAPWVDVVQENGSVTTFTADGAGGFAAPLRVLATLERLPDGTYRFVRQQRQTYLFDASGRLTSVQDANGNADALSYDSAGNLTTITDTSNRTLTVTWSGSHITAVSDPTGRTVSYAYSTAGDLIDVTQVDGTHLGYTYDSAHRLVVMTNAQGQSTTNVYDSSNRVTTQTDALKRVSTFAYASGQTTITEPDGSVTIERYTNGQVLSETKAAGTKAEATTTFVYGPTNQVVSQTDALGRTATFTYDGAGNRTSATDALGRTSTMTYNGFKEPLTVTNPAGETTTFTYDEHGNLLSKTDPTGAVTQFTVNPDGTVATATDATGAVTRFSYDAHGYLASTTDPTGAVTTAVFDALGRQVSATDPRGNVTGADPAQFTSTIAYDPAGRPTSTTDAYGSGTSMAYDAVGNVTSSTDQLGQVTTFTYDAAGQRLTATDPTGAVTRWSYDKAGRVTTVTGPDGGVAMYSYDPAGNRTAVTNPDGKVTTSTFDLAGRVTSTTTPSGGTTTYTYDAAGQVVKVVDPNGHATTTSYDQAGRPVTVTDALGRAVSTTYDKAGRTTQVTRADGSKLAWGYDAAGRQTSYTDASGAVTTYAYDTAGRLKSATDVAGRVTSYAYDVAGHQTVVTYPDGGTATSTYDRLGRLTGTTYSGTTPATTKAYDAASRLTTATSGSSSTSYVYDGAGRATTVTTDGATVGYDWTAGGQLAKLTYPGGNAVSYAYDKAGQLTKATDWAGRDYQYTWTDNGQVDTLTYPNGVVTHHDYDSAGQATAITSDTSAGTQLLKLAYAYDDAGQLASQRTDRSTGPRAPPTTPVTTSTYAWDPLGQVGQVTGTETGAYSFTATGQVTQLADGSTLAYDAAGQVTTRTTATGTDGTPGQATTYGYNTLGQRISATGPDGKTTSYTYDQTGKLTTLTDPAGATSTYTYEASGLRATTTTSAGTQRFVWDTTTSVAQLLSDGTHQYVYGVGSTPIAQTDTTGAVDYLHTDLTGSVRTITDHTGNVVADSDYTAYGTPTDVNGTPVSALTPFGFAGQYTDPTGLLYLRARYYDPATTQFLTIDPLLATTHQPYAYTPGNPLQHVDPLGLDWMDNFSDGIAGFGDIITFGGTKQIRRLLNYELNGDMHDVANSCTAAYKWGEGIGVAASLALGGEGLVNVGARAISAGKAAFAGAKAASAARSAAAAAEGVDAAGEAIAGTNQAARLANAACFTAGTPVLLADGAQKPIELIKAGDKVSAFNLDTQRTEARRVVRVFVHHGVPTYRVTLSDGSSVVTTRDHPFFVVGRGWTSAHDLGLGDSLRQQDGTSVGVRSARPTGETATVYNFEVEGLHDYYVGAGGHWILVHNTCDADLEGLEHVIARHTAAGGERDAAAGVFDNGADLADLASRSAGQIGIRNAATGNIEYVVRAKGIVGVVGSSGLPTSTYTIVRNSYGELITMYPGG